MPQCVLIQISAARRTSKGHKGLLDVFLYNFLLEMATTKYQPLQRDHGSIDAALESGYSVLCHFFSTEGGV